MSDRIDGVTEVVNVAELTPRRDAVATSAELFDAALRAATGGASPGCSRSSSAAAKRPARSGGSPPARGPRLHRRHHRGAGRGQVDAHQRARRAPPLPGDEVAVLAIDPSSPFTGGAILGDRVRMQDHATDPACSSARWRRGPPRRPRARDARGGPPARRGRAAAGARRDGRRRPGRGRDRRQGRHDDRRRQPGLGRQRAGQQGRADGGRRRLRDQQGRPPGRRQTRRDLEQMLDLARDWPTHDERGARRSSPPSPPTATGSPSCGRPSASTATTPPESGLLERRRAGRLREELGEVVARRLRSVPSELCGEERWRELTEAVLARELDPWAAADELIAPALSPP